jgi:predicted dehydrogenase
MIKNFSKSVLIESAKEFYYITFLIIHNLLPMNSKTFSRREFMKLSSSSLALASLGWMSFTNIGNKEPLKVALIGCGWYGKNDLLRLIQIANVEVVALCDVDENHLQETRALVLQRQPMKSSPMLYKHYEELLSQHQLDIVVIGTPDHWHALQAIAAIESGAHVYLQKPISVDVLEGEAVVATAKKYNKMVQVGLQRRSTPHLIAAKNQTIDKGLLGKISHVEICCYYHMRANGNPSNQEVPKHFDYDLWTGPAPLRPFDGLPHGSWWRTFMEYGNGITGDMCVHMLDCVRWMLGIKEWPTKIYATGGIFVQKEGKSNIADTQIATFEYPELKIIWQHRTWGNPADEEYPWSFKIYGEKGMLAGSPFKANYQPLKGDKMEWEAVLEKEKYPEDVTEKGIEIHTAPATRKHFENLIAAIKTEKEPIADVMQAHISTASCILANLSMQLGRPLSYDPEIKEIVNDPEATQLLQRPYRSPYVHP